MIRKYEAEVEVLEDAERELKEAKARVHHLETVAIPELMLEAGVSEFKTGQGVKVSLRDILVATMPKSDNDREDVLHWLCEHDRGEVIKSKIEGFIDRNPELRDAVSRALGALGISALLVDSVHPQTLNKVVREMLEEGITPPEPLKIYQGKKAVVK